MAKKPTPLTDLIIAMSHSPELQDQFISQQRDNSLIEQFGVTPEQLRLLRQGDLAEINAAVAAEAGYEPSSYQAPGPADAGGSGPPVVTHWIRVAKWITTAADEEEDDSEDNS
jgi:hypothetical protein